jgi:hypothetical protein
MISPFVFAPQHSIVDDYMPEGRKNQAFFPHGPVMKFKLI